MVITRIVSAKLFLCKSGKLHKTGASALCTVDDASWFHIIRLRPKTSVYEKHVSVKSTVAGCDVTTAQQHCKGSTSILLLFFTACMNESGIATPKNKSRAIGSPTSKSRTMTLHETRLPASLHTLAAALSTANPLWPRTPEFAHAARWWPLESSGRLHRQMRETGGKGCQRRRRSRTRNS